MYDIVRPLPQLRAACVRRVGPYGPGIGEAFQTLMKRVGKDIPCGPQTLFLAAYYDDPQVTPPEKCRADACVTLPDGVQIAEDEEIQVRELPGGEYAAFLRAVNDLADFPGIWREIYERGLARLHRHPDGTRPCYEVYYNCGESNPLRRWAVDICVPVL